MIFVDRFAVSTGLNRSVDRIELQLIWIGCGYHLYGSDPHPMRIGFGEVWKAFYTVPRPQAETTVNHV